MMITNLFIIRHGETDWNRTKRFQGHIDIPLNQTGREQAEQLKSWFMGKRLDRIFSSDLQRAYQTAKPLADLFQLEIATYKSLRERSYGSLEGKFADEVFLHYSAELGDWAEVEEYGIEPIHSVKERVYSQIRTIIQTCMDKNIAIVSHGASINAFLSVISHGEYGSGKTKILNTGVTHIETDGNDWRIVTLNDVSHLSDSLKDEVI